MGKRKAAVLSTLCERGRSTSMDLTKLTRRDHGLAFTDDGVRAILVTLQDSGLIEPSEPHIDRGGVLRGTWVPTTAGRSALKAAR